MNKLDFEVPFVGLDKKPIEQGGTIGRTLGNALATATKGDAVKLNDWAIKIFNGDPIDIDQSDTDMLKAFINQHEGLTNMLKAQLLAVIRDADSEKKKK